MSELGDISEILKEGSVVNLDWLNVDEKDYLALEALPKQNLDITPDLEALWSHKDVPASKLVPNREAPKTMGDLSETHGKLRKVPEDLIKTARLALMQSHNVPRVLNILASRYDRETLLAAKSVLSSALSERGLLGHLYICAQDFTNCRDSSEFVKRFAFEAKYVLAKKACVDCANRNRQSDGSNHCGVFHKEIVVNVPYTEGLAEEVEGREASKGKSIQASAGDPRNRIRAAILAEPTASTPSFTGIAQKAPSSNGVNPKQALVAVENLTKQKVAKEAKDLLEIKSRPIVAMLQREMIKGRSTKDLLENLRLAFTVPMLQETKAVWAPLVKEAGILGTVYIPQEAFSDCKEGADFVNRHRSKARAILAGEKCTSCISHKAGLCMMYGRKLVASVDEIVTPQTVQAVIEEGRIAGDLPTDASNRSWGNTPAEALKAIHVASTSGGVNRQARTVLEKAYYGGSFTKQTNDLTKRAIVRQASKYLNEGLYGEELRTALQKSFSSTDLLATAPELKVVLAEQGLQGIKYIDPTVYADYGKGCAEAARLHRARSAVRYAKVGSACAGCLGQSCPGKCSTLNKELVVEPPYMDKLAEQRAILASGDSTKISYESLMNNGLSMMQEYQLQNQPLEVEVDSVKASTDVWVALGTNKELKL